MVNVDDQTITLTDTTADDVTANGLISCNGPDATCTITDACIGPADFTSGPFLARHYGNTSEPGYTFSGVYLDADTVEIQECAFLFEDAVAGDGLFTCADDSDDVLEYCPLTDSPPTSAPTMTPTMMPDGAPSTMMPTMMPDDESDAPTSPPSSTTSTIGKLSAATTALACFWIGFLTM